MKDGKLGRIINRARVSFPGIWNFSRSVYRRLNYMIFREIGFECALHPDVKLLTPDNWIANDQLGNGEMFFGYYDKSPWSIEMDKFLLHHKYVDEKVQIVLYDRYACEQRCITQSSAWNYQQGSMTQWLPGHENKEIILNDFVDGNLVSRIISINGDTIRTIPWPIQAVHPQGNAALTLNYCRLDALRPDYGYRVSAKNFHFDDPLDEDGIWWINLITGEASLQLNLGKLAEFSQRKEMKGAKHKVNHFSYAPDGEHFVFMHRWFGTYGKFSRLFVAEKKMRYLKLLMDNRMVSHYSWKDNEHLIVWARTHEEGDHFYMVNIHSGNTKVLGENVLDIYGDGHPTFSPNKRWIITDSYPDKARQNHLILYNVESNDAIEIGRFFSPWKFISVERCDLHPRWSPDGKYISIDSAHSGIRKSYILDVSKIV